MSLWPGSFVLFLWFGKLDELRLFVRARRARPDATPLFNDASASDGFSRVTVVLVLLMIMIGGAAAKIVEVRIKRIRKAELVQARISDVLLGDPQLARHPITPTVCIPMRRSKPVTIAVNGVIPSADLRRHALRIVEE